jgi:hypothetical protein
MSISQKKKRLLIEYVDNKCEHCSSNIDLEIHRIRRGIQGGTYEHRNCKVLCKSCHKKFHYKE